MARETRSRLGEGAAPSAPTATHATPPSVESKATTGPQRFWATHRARFGVVAGLSLVVHWLAGPWSFLPQGPSVDVHDLDGELTIPIDTMAEAPEEQPKPTPTAATTGAANGDLPTKGGTLDASPDRRAPPVDSGHGESDAGAGADLTSSEGGADAEVLDEGGVAMGGGDGGDAGAAGSGSPFAGVSAGPNNVTLTVNMSVIRAQPAGAKVGLLMAAIPQWRQFLTSSSSAGATLDPLRDCDWILVMGPALDHTEKDAVYVHYSAADAVVDTAIDGIAKGYAKGGPIDVKVKGVKAWRAYADGGERVFLRPRSHVAVIVPSSHATQFAQVVAQSPFNPHMRPGEAVSLRALRPGGSISIIPASISEARLWVVPRAGDGGADVYGEGDCPDDASALLAAEQLRGEVTRRNSIGVRMVTGGLLNGLTITSDGPTVKLHLSATKEQIDGLMNLAAGQLGVTFPGDAPAPSSPLR